MPLVEREGDNVKRIQTALLPYLYTSRDIHTHCDSKMVELASCFSGRTQILTVRKPLLDF